MRAHIVSEIKRLAALAGGQPPGNQSFVSTTGIVPSKWLGKYWARWSDALKEAGFEPNSWTVKTDANSILVGIIASCRHYGRFPTKAEMEMLRASGEVTIPAADTIQRNIGRRAELLTALRSYMGADPRFDDVRAMLPPIVQSRSAQPKESKTVAGHVYLIKSGRFHKIGRTDNLDRRFKEIKIALPDAVNLIHTITTDDPPGIEAYWHRRFVDRRANGE